MKGIKLAGALALALSFGVLATNLDAFALENSMVVTTMQLNGAIENAELALSATAGISSVAGQAKYLQNLVNQAKALSYDVAGNQDKNLGELVDALNEGARGLILTSGVTAKKETPTETLRSVTPAAPVATPAPTTQAQPAEQAVPANVRTVAAEVATNQVATNVSVTVAEDEPVAEKTTEIATDAPELPLGENEEVDVPNTGETQPSPIAVGITVGMAVFVALAGALAIVKRLKRNA